MTLYFSEHGRYFEKLFKLPIQWKSVGSNVFKTLFTLSAWTKEKQNPETFFK